MNLRNLILDLGVPLLFAAMAGCQRGTEAQKKPEIKDSIAGVRSPDDGIRIPLNFPAPKWEVGDWWELDYQYYVTSIDVKRQPAGYDLKEGWGKIMRWKYEVVDLDKIGGDDCYVLEARDRGTIVLRWHRISDLLLKQEAYDSPQKREKRKVNSKSGIMHDPIKRIVDNVGPVGREANFTLPLGMPLFGVARNISSYKQSLTEIDKNSLVDKTHDAIRERILSLLGPRSAKIVINAEGGDYPETQYWNSGLPWFVYGEHTRLSGEERSRYWLVDFGKKGEKNDAESL